MTMTQHQVIYTFFLGTTILRDTPPEAQNDRFTAQYSIIAVHDGCSLTGFLLETYNPPPYA
ncbi:MAG TPA: hypothetical protein EYN18_04505 [Nitrospirales bacterium]|nr:hypothetical protein [Nitrospirales bacterium]